VSYDLQIWSVLRPSLPDHLPGRAEWTDTGTAWAYTKPTWQITTRLPDHVERDDVPDEIVTLLPAIEFLTEFNLSPVDAGPSARRALDRIAKRFAKAVHGIVVNPQDETVTLPSGVKRLSPLGNAQEASLLTMKWRFVEGALMRRDVADLIEAFERLLPEGLPRRYGCWEPPQHRLSVEGKDHFVRFMAENERVVWYAHAPVEGVYLYVPTARDLQRGFRSGELELSIDLDALRQPGWPAAVRHAWEAVSLLVRPFYGAVFTSRGWERKNGRYWRGPNPSVTRPAGPTYGNLWGWWRGIPRGRAAQAVVLGPPYISLWKAFEERCRRVGDFGFIDGEDWTQSANALADGGPVPEELAEPLRRPDGDSDYPPVWPFADRQQ
jgi:hypothetical protein